MEIGMPLLAMLLARLILRTGTPKATGAGHVVIFKIDSTMRKLVYVASSLAFAFERPMTGTKRINHRRNQQ